MSERRQAGFTLVELMIVVLIVGILAALAIPNFISMQDRAREGSTKANMHTFQLSTEDYAVQHDAVYPATAGAVVSVMSNGGANLRNPFTGGTGLGTAYETRAAFNGNPVATAGITSYADSAGHYYKILGRGKSNTLPLVLSEGQ